MRYAWNTGQIVKQISIMLQIPHDATKQIIRAARHEKSAHHFRLCGDGLLTPKSGSGKILVEPRLEDDVVTIEMGLCLPPEEDAVLATGAGSGQLLPNFERLEPGERHL